MPGLYHVVPLGPDRVQVANAGRTVVLSGPGFSERVMPLLDALDGASTRQQLEDRFPELVPAVLEGLMARDLLTDAAKPDEDQASQLTALGIPSGPSPAEAAGRLAAVTVAVVGGGPVADAVAVLLAKAGVGRLRLHRDCTPLALRDVIVSPCLPASAVDRTMPEIIGQLFGKAVETASRRSDPTYADLVVIESTYRSESDEHSEADSCLAAGVPYLLHGQDALEAVVGPLVRGDRGPCHRCAQARRLGVEDHIDEHLAYRSHRSSLAPGPDAFLASHAAVVAGVAATEALCVLVGGDPQTAGAALVIDLASLSVRREVILPVPGCQCQARTA